MSGVQTLAKPRRIKASHRRRGKVASGPIVQRYYDPGIGRFLSVDPVTAYGGDNSHFNRYAYAYNNPYKFTDPDGRLPVFVIPLLKSIAGATGFGITNVTMQMHEKGKTLSTVDWSEDIDWSDVAVGVTAGAVIPGGLSVLNSLRKAAPMIKGSVQAIKKLASQARRTPARAAKLDGRVAKHVRGLFQNAGDVAAVGGYAVVGAAAVKTAQKAINQLQNPPPPPPPPPPPVKEQSK